MESNILNLRFSGEILTLINSQVDEVIWYNGNDNYQVAIEVEDTYDYFHIILSDKNNEKVLELKTCKLNGNKYKGSFIIPRVLKNGERVHVGVIAKKKNAKNAIASAPFSVKIKNSIATPSTFGINTTEIKNSGFTTLLNMLNGGMVIKSIELQEVTKTGTTKKEKHLIVSYATNANTSAKIDLGKVNLDLEDLGAEIKREGEGKGGGAKLGKKTSLTGGQQGFAGGYGAKAANGVALGYSAETVNGIAIGYDSRSDLSSNSIAIGYRARLDDNSQYAVALGGYTKITNSPRSIAIGGGNNQPSDDKSINYDHKAPYVDLCDRTFAIGYNTNASKLWGGIVIGANATGRGRPDTGKYQNCISIGHSSDSSLNGAIAIGVGAKSGVWESENKNGDETVFVATGNQTDDKNYGFSAIAIGHNADARRAHSIAMGRNATTHRGGSIAIGYKSIAGKNPEDIEFKNSQSKKIDEKNVTTDIEKDNDSSGYGAVAIGAITKAAGWCSVALGYNTQALNKTAVAIGGGAKSQANGAIQLGNGTNKTPLSLRFRNRTICVEDKLQIDFAKDAVAGVLPINKGGTGSTNVQNALAALGIRYGQTSLTLGNGKGGDTVKDHEVFFDSSKKAVYEAPPKVFLTLVDNGTIGERYSVIIRQDESKNKKGVTEADFHLRATVGPDHNGKAYGGSNKVYINWLAIGVPKNN